MFKSGLLFFLLSVIFSLTASLNQTNALVGVYGRVYDKTTGQGLNCVNVPLSWTSSDPNWGGGTRPILQSHSTANPNGYDPNYQGWNFNNGIGAGTYSNSCAPGAVYMACGSPTYCQSVPTGISDGYYSYIGGAYSCGTLGIDCAPFYTWHLGNLSVSPTDQNNPACWPQNVSKVGHFEPVYNQNPYGYYTLKEEYFGMSDPKWTLGNGGNVYQDFTWINDLPDCSSLTASTASGPLVSGASVQPGTNVSFNLKSSGPATGVALNIVAGVASNVQGSCPPTVYDSQPPVTPIASGNTFAWTAGTAGTYTAFGRVWNDGIAECRAACVDGPPRYICGSASMCKLTINVVNPPTITPTPTKTLITPTLTPTSPPPPTPTPTTPILSSCPVWGTFDKSGTGSKFVSIDPVAKTVTAIGNQCNLCELEGLDSHPVTGVIYSVIGTSGDLITINPTTGARTVVAKISNSLGNVDALSFRKSDNSLWGWSSGHGLVTINITTGATTLIISKSTLNIQGLAWDANSQNLYGSLGTNLYKIDPVAKTVTKIAGNLPATTDALDMTGDGLLKSNYRLNGILYLYSYNVSTKSVVSTTKMNASLNNIESMDYPLSCWK